MDDDQSEFPLAGPDAGDRDIDAALLSRYLAGQASVREVAQIETHLATHADTRDWIASARVAITQGGDVPTLSAFAITKRAANIRHIADSGSLAPIGSSPLSYPRPMSSVLRRWWPIGAAAGLVVAVIASYLVGHGVFRVVPVGGSMQEYATALGQRLSVGLPDGTRVTLAPDSRLRVAAGYGRPDAAGGRNVELDGEAYFEVRHDAASPFAVHAHGTVVRDVGTAFDVRAYPENAGIRVAVKEGEVRLCPDPTSGGSADAANQSFPCHPDLRAGDIGTVVDGTLALTHQTDITSYTAWMQGHLVFEDTPLRQVIKDLSRAYDITVTLADSSLSERPLTASFAHESLDEVLAIVTQAVDARFERDGRRVVIRRKPKMILHPDHRTAGALSIAQRASNE